MKITTKEKQRLRRKFKQRNKSQRFMTMRAKENWKITTKDPVELEKAINRHDERLKKKLEKNKVKKVIKNKNASKTI